MSEPAILQGIARQMHYLSDRQRVIAQNVANSETPGYRARDLSAPDFSALVEAQGSAGHIARPTVALTEGMRALGASSPAAGGTILDPNVSEVKPDGNNVTLEDQLLHLGQVQADFAALTGLYRKQLSLLRTAIGRGGGS